MGNDKNFHNFYYVKQNTKESEEDIKKQIGYTNLLVDKSKLKI